MTANFSFPEAANTTTSDNAASPSTTPGGLSTGAKAAIGAGVAAGAIFAGLGLAFFLVRRRRRATTRAVSGMGMPGKQWEGLASTSQMQLVQRDSASRLDSAEAILILYFYSTSMYVKSMSMIYLSMPLFC